MYRFDIRPALRDLKRDLNSLQREQVPFATALALTRIAQNVAKAEVENLSEVFDNPTPFTKKGVAIISANKRTLTATVYIREIQAQYLLPYKDGGVQALRGKRAILAPRGSGVNTYGNLPRSKLATLKAQTNVFVGRVKTKKGSDVSGVWRRVGKGAKARLRLLIQFADPKPVHQRLGFEDRARQVIAATAGPEFEAAMAKALATARR